MGQSPPYSHLSRSFLSHLSCWKSLFSLIWPWGLRGSQLYLLKSKHFDLNSKVGDSRCWLNSWSGDSTAGILNNWPGDPEGWQERVLWSHIVQRVIPPLRSLAPPTQPPPPASTLLPASHGNTDALSPLQPPPVILDAPELFILHYSDIFF